MCLYMNRNKLKLAQQLLLATHNVRPQAACSRALSQDDSRCSPPRITISRAVTASSAVSLRIVAKGSSHSLAVVAASRQLNSPVRAPDVHY